MFHKLPPLVEKPIPSSCNKFLSKSIEVFSSLCLADRRTDAVELGTVTWSAEAVERLAICSNAVCNVHAARQIVPRFASYEQAKEKKIRIRNTWSLKLSPEPHEAHIKKALTTLCISVSERVLRRIKPWSPHVASSPPISVTFRSAEP